MPDPLPIEALLQTPVSAGRTRQEFGTMTLAQVEARAAELGATAEIPAMAGKLAPVAAAWRGLAQRMERAGAATVAELPPDGLAELAGRLWVVPPGGSLL